jgi:hypothetical protein
LIWLGASRVFPAFKRVILSWWTCSRRFDRKNPDGLVSVRGGSTHRLNVLKFLMEAWFLFSKIVFILDSQPKLRGVPEIPRQPKCGICGDATFPFENLRNSCGRHPGILGEPIRGNTERGKKLFLENLTGSYIWYSFHRVYPSMIIGDLNVLSLSIVPTKADPPLAIDANTVLAGTVSREFLKVIAGRHAQVGNILGMM